MTIQRIAIAVLLIVSLASSAAAFSLNNSFRLQADSQYRIAEKAYRKAVKDYGKNLQGYPSEEKADACRKMSSALHDNRTQINLEDVLNQQKYRRQYNKLLKYSKLLGCTK